MRLFITATILKLSLCSLLFSQYKPEGFEGVELGMSPSALVDVRPNAKPLSVAPDSTSGAEQEQNLDSVEALLEVVPDGRPAHVMFKFIDSSLSSATYVYGQSERNTLLKILESNGSYHGIEPSAEKNRAMVKWSFSDGTNAYLTLPTEFDLTGSFSVIYQIMSKVEVEQFEAYRNSDNQPSEFESMSSVLDEKLKNLITLDSSPSVTTSTSSTEETAESTEETSAPEPATEKSAEAATPEPSEEPAEPSSNWWLWLIGAVVVVGGILVLRPKK